MTKKQVLEEMVREWQHLVAECDKLDSTWEDVVRALPRARVLEVFKDLLGEAERDE